MAQGWQRQSPSSKDGGSDRRDQQREVRRLVGGSLGRAPSLAEILGWEYNAVLTSLTFRIKDGVWSSVVKADFGPRPMVAFVDVGSFARCVEVTIEFATKRSLKWYPDKYPPKTRTYQP